MLFWKKAWVWIKHHWYVPVLFVLILFALLVGQGVKNKYFNLMVRQRENYKKEIDMVKEETHAKEEKKEEIIEKNKEIIKKIEDDHKVELEKLEEEKKEELTIAIEEHKDKPDKLAKKIAEILGAEYIKNNKQ